MRIVQLIPGTGSFYCGSCLRDNTLGHALRRRGHDVQMVPLYLPFMLEEHDPQENEAVFLGGINMYLHQKAPIVSRLPHWMLGWLDSPRLLRWASRRSDMTGAAELGDLTLSTLRGRRGRQAAEVDRLINWLRGEPRPDVILLSNAMLCGLVEPLLEEARCPIVCSLQGEAPFLDSLPLSHRAQAWRLMRDQLRGVRRFIAVSRYYGELMTDRLALPPDRVQVIHNGIELDDLPRSDSVARERRPTIGYLARLCADKGLHTLCDAFILLKKRPEFAAARLRLAGAMLKGDRPFVQQQRRKLRRASVLGDVEFLPNIERSAKIDLLRSLDVLSVPATYGESFGLYVLEALACGVPVVQPRHASFPELLEATGGGVLCEPNDPAALAEALAALLTDAAGARALGAAGRARVREHFSADRMAREVEQMCMMLTSAPAAAAADPLPA
ncbi:MAG: glycosyltransferase family 4 protein [Phycisphaerales bacterium]|nr:glycosyltransferase family 4 protein [Phycisphaerales bacterium]